jgi:hypothetical protein
MDLGRRSAAVGRVWAFGVIIGEPLQDPLADFRPRLEGMEIDAFVFERPPEPLNEDVVHPMTAPVHGHLYARIGQDCGEPWAGELAG